MKTSLVITVVVGATLMFGPNGVQAEEIRGAIGTTKVITENSILTGNVTCTVTGAACIQFGASDITLMLNGFSITGQAHSITGCRGASTGGENGINVVNRTDVTVLGPGLVQRFRGQGINIQGGGRVLVTNVTSSNNCMSGIFLAAASTDNHIEG